ncbi:MADS-box transcription factor 2-like [Rutidosis leptorrhynchoides]|uniref:MADS-box transcription factor 2-like n=1 Tax=Rutidosis leptorrhynchoides TaxID=125765 RepID=UPI003A98DE4A
MAVSKMVEIKRIDDREKRNSAFHKRSEGLLKKARKLSIMCDADVGVVIFSYSGNLKEYVSSPRVFERYNNNNNKKITWAVYREHGYLFISKKQNF